MNFTLTNMNTNNNHKIVIKQYIRIKKNKNNNCTNLICSLLDNNNPTYSYPKHFTIISVTIINRQLFNLRLMFYLSYFRWSQNRRITKGYSHFG